MHGPDSRSTQLLDDRMQRRSRDEATSTQNESSRGHVDSIAATGLRVSRSRRLWAQVAGRLDRTGADGFLQFYEKHVGGGVTDVLSKMLLGR
jgi:hypothetical protein